MQSNGLPVQITPFVGREDELAQIADLLHTPDCQLLTLIGPGGIGKTRLALEAARQCTIFDSVHFVPLQPLTSPDFMLPAIADSLQFATYGSQPLKDQLLSYLEKKKLLLVIDNFEHLLDGVDLLSEILTAAAEIKILVTSRERLRLREEWVLEVGGLDYPTNEAETAIEHYSTVELFVQQARRANAGFMLTDQQKPAIIRICRLVGGVPLGVELAAAWVRTLSCKTIADELTHSLNILETSVRNVEPRHRTMNATFEPTWNRLTEDERSVFMKLSVFRGGFTREAAGDVAGASLRTLSALVDKSLLRISASGRYDLHELLRQYGAERLDELDEAVKETCDCHCTYYAYFMEKQWPRLRGAEIKAALQDINVELDNVRAAWSWAANHHKAAAIEAMYRSLWFFYGVGSRYQEGEQLFASVVPAFKNDMAVYGKLLSRWGELIYLAGWATTATKILEESLSLLRQVDARDDIAFVLYRLELIGIQADRDYSKGFEYLQESLAIYTELGNYYGMGEVLFQLGQFYYYQHLDKIIDGAAQRGQQCFQEGLAAFEQYGSTFGISIVHLGLSNAAHWQGDYRQCWHEAERALEFCKELGIGWGIVWSLSNIASAACYLEEYTAARQYTLEMLLYVLKMGWQNHARWNLEGLHMSAAIFIGEGRKEHAYELLGVISEHLHSFGISNRNLDLSLLHLLDDELPPSLEAAVKRGRARDRETVLQELVTELSNPSSTPSVMPLPTYPRGQSYSQRELEILRHLADGLNSREIALRLHLSVTTIRWYLREMYSKLDVHSRSEALARAKELKLLV